MGRATRAGGGPGRRTYPILSPSAPPAASPASACQPRRRARGSSATGYRNICATAGGRLARLALRLVQSQPYPSGRRTAGRPATTRGAMLSVPEAQSLVLKAVSPLPAEMVPLTAAALGLILAEDVVSDIDSPPH